MSNNSDNLKNLITIDGPAASGKTSVSRELAQRLGWNWVSTGAFYRGLGYVALQLKVNLNDPAGLVRLAQSQDWSVQMSAGRTQVHFRGQDVTNEIGAEEVGTIASKISRYAEVRAALLESQRTCQQIGPGLIAEGRDCGTIVFPDAPFKVYLTAKQEDRAARRATELGLSPAQTLEAQKSRDHADESRKTAPLQIPNQAFVVDATQLNFEQVVDTIEREARLRLGI